MRSFVWQGGDAYLQRLNPLSKALLLVPVVVVASFAFDPLVPLALMALALLATRVLGRVSWPSLLRPLALAGLLSFGMFWTSAVFYVGPGAEAGAPSHWLGPLRLTEAGLVYGAAMASRLLAIFSVSLLFVLTTDPSAFVLALIQQARMPYRVGYAVFAAYRFIPLLHEEFDNVRAAHQMRGAVGRGLLGRLREYLGYAIPLLAITVRKAERLALAMDARAFGALPERTYFRQTVVGWNDALFLAGALGVLALVVVLRGIAG